MSIRTEWIMVVWHQWKKKATEQVMWLRLMNWDMKTPTNNISQLKNITTKEPSQHSLSFKTFSHFIIVGVYMYVWGVYEWIQAHVCHHVYVGQRIIWRSYLFHFSWGLRFKINCHACRGSSFACSDISPALKVPLLITPLFLGSFDTPQLLCVWVYMVIFRQVTDNYNICDVSF